MKVNYDNFAETFAQSRSNLKWPEISYLFSFIDINKGIIDIACGSGRLLQVYQQHFSTFPQHYYGIDASQKLLLEAQNQYPGLRFSVGTMESDDTYLGVIDAFQNINKCIFCIAGFHHILDFNDRIKTFQYWYNLLDTGERVYMTNWALESPRNINAYKNAMIQGSENQFGSHDFSIKIGKYYRWYHSFSLSELEYLANVTQFNIVENQISSTGKNYITILEK